MADVRGWIGYDWEFGYIFVTEEEINSDDDEAPRMPDDAIQVSVPEQDYADYLRAQQQLAEWDQKLVQLRADGIIAACPHPGRWESGERTGQCTQCGTHLTDAWTGPRNQLTLPKTSHSR